MNSLKRADDTAEGRRVADTAADSGGSKLRGPYLSEEQWGTVREDYSAATPIRDRGTR